MLVPSEWRRANIERVIGIVSGRNESRTQLLGDRCSGAIGLEARGPEGYRFHFAVVALRGEFSTVEGEVHRTSISSLDDHLVVAMNGTIAVGSKDIGEQKLPVRCDREPRVFPSVDQDGEYSCSRSN